jgi:hypothetical protein
VIAPLPPPSPPPSLPRPAAAAKPTGVIFSLLSLAATAWIVFYNVHQRSAESLEIASLAKYLPRAGTPAAMSLPRVGKDGAEFRKGPGLNYPGLAFFGPFYNIRVVREAGNGYVEIEYKSSYGTERAFVLKRSLENVP